jgi:hypothetical protein
LDPINDATKPPEFSGFFQAIFLALLESGPKFLLQIIHLPQPMRAIPPFLAPRIPTRWLLHLRVSLLQFRFGQNPHRIVEILMMTENP